MQACQIILWNEFLKDFPLREHPQVMRGSQEDIEIWSREAKWSQTTEVNVQEKKRCSLISSRPQNTQLGLSLELNVCCQLRVDSLLSMASQQIKECLRVIPLNQINKYHDTFGQ